LKLEAGSRRVAELPAPVETRVRRQEAAPLRVLFFGTASTEEGYPRTRVLLRGLREAGAVVEECRVPLWSRSGERTRAARSLLSLGTLGRIARAQAGLVRGYLRAGDHDVALVGAEGHLDVLLLRALQLLRRRPLVFDPFLSLHDTIVEDRRLVREGSWAARALRFLDGWAGRLADGVLVDTDAMGRRFERDLGVPAGRTVRLFVGEEPERFGTGRAEPLPEPPAPPLEVLWFGTHIPLHGTRVIVEAARALRGEGVRFTLVGAGQELEGAAAAARGLDNVRLLPRFLEAPELKERIRRSHVCLGIFGATAKAGRVIPCKVFDALSAGRALVTADTPAARELLVPDRHALLVPPGDPGALAEAILKLRDDPLLRHELARRGLRLYRERATPAVLGGELLDYLRSLCRRS